MDLVRCGTATELLDAAGGFLVEREAEHNLPLGILATLRDEPDIYPAPPYLATVMDAGQVALVAVRTPPHGLVLSEPGVAVERLGEAAAILVADLAAVAPDLPSVLGPAASVGPFAGRWALATGHRAALQVAERIYRLSRVVPAPGVPGAWRLAGEGDHGRLLEWARAFQDEALPVSPIVGLEAMVERWARRQGRLAYLWEVEDRAVSLVVAGARTPNGRRIGPVYTPPEARGHGYGTALTAAASQDQLDRGHAFCFLFADLANPTSNAIYRRIGYEPVTDVDQVRFVDRGDGGPPGAVSPP